MKIRQFVHSIPEPVLLSVIVLGVAILLVYFITTINALKAQVESMRVQQIQRTEEILKRAREERQIDMATFFNTNTISYSCEE